MRRSPDQALSIFHAGCSPRADRKRRTVRKECDSARAGRARMEVRTMTSQFPQPPNPWDTDVWLEMTRSTLWLVGPWGRCILEAGDDAWPGGKLGGRYCDEQTHEVFAAIALPPDPMGLAIAALRAGVASGNAPTPSVPGSPFPGTEAFFPVDPLVILDAGKPVPEEISDAIAVVPVPMTATLLMCAVLAVTALRISRRRAACL